MINLAEAAKRRAENKTEEKLRVLGISITGVGKTIAFASWPGKTLIFDFERRYESIFDWYPERLSEIDVEEITASNYFSVFQKKVNDLCDHNPYANIILSGITSLSNTTIMMQMIAKGDIQKEKGKEYGEKTGIKFTKGGISVPTWDEINGETMAISLLLETLKSLNCNLFIEAHPLKRQKEGEEYESIVAYGPKIESIIPTYFNEIWYFAMKSNLQGGGMSRKVYTSPTNEYKLARTSIKKLPDVIDITNKKLYNEIKPYLT